MGLEDDKSSQLTQVSNPSKRQLGGANSLPLRNPSELFDDLDVMLDVLNSNNVLVSGR